MATATTLSDPASKPSAPLSLRVAVMGFVTPVVLMLVAWIGYAIWALLWRFAAPGITAIADAVETVGQPTFMVVLITSVVNALFEEMLWLGLGVAALHAAGVRLTFAATISLGLRVLVHVYQGPLALLAILPLGTVFTIYYLRTRRLWPVVVAHALQDLLALVVIVLRTSR